MVLVTREKLIELAREETERRSQTEDVISGYLIGSVASGEPFIDGTADIDLILIHQNEPARSREWVPLSENIHLDIIHHPSDLYNHPPMLRMDPWLGPSMCEPIFLYDPDHFFERAQAGVRGQFYQINYVHARALAFLERARRHKANLPTDHAWISNYAHSILKSVNALVTLGGFPVAGRRVALLLQDRLKEIGFEEYSFAFQNLLGANSLPKEQLPEWFNAWQDSIHAAGYLNPAFNLSRENYFLHAFRSLVDSNNSEAILWNLLTTWGQANEIIQGGKGIPPHYTIWKDVLTQLKLSPKYRDTRDAELEVHLGNIEEILMNWS